jgi:tetratricopeptide (TPR) repeat protein
MIKTNQSTYVSLDDYENLFMYYTRICRYFNCADEINEEMAGLVIRAGIEQYPNSAVLQMFSIYYKYLNGEYFYHETLKLLRCIEFPKYEKLELSYYKSEILMNMGAYEEAIPMFLELLTHPQTHQDKIEIYSELLTLTLQKESSLTYEEKEEKGKGMSTIMYYLDKLISLEPESERKILTRARYQTCSYNFNVPMFEEYAETHPFSVVGWYVLAQEYLSHLRYDKAVEALEYAIALSNDVNLFIFMGNIYKTWGKNKEALDYYHEAMTHSLSIRSFYKDIAELFSWEGQSDTAKYYYNLFLEHYPDNIEVLMDLSFLFFTEQKTDIAILYLERALEIDPCNEEVLSLLTKCFILENKNVEILKLLVQTIDKYPDVVSAWLACSNYYVLVGEYDRALEVLNQGLDVLPDDVQLIYRMANCYFMDNDNACGINCLRLAIMMDTDMLYLSDFANYDRRAAKLPEVTDLIKELLIDRK